MGGYFKLSTNGYHARAFDDISEKVGEEFKYLKRSITNDDLILGEAIESNFSSYKNITLFVKSYTSNGAEIEGDIFANMGFLFEDTMQLTISPIRLQRLIIDPKEGDILYHPELDKMFEIKDVSTDRGFALKNEYGMYTNIMCKPFNMDSETIDTGLEEIDRTNGIEDTNTSDEIDSFTELRSLFMEE